MACRGNILGGLKHFVRTTWKTVFWHLLFWSLSRDRQFRDRSCTQLVKSVCFRVMVSFKREPNVYENITDILSDSNRRSLKRFFDFLYKFLCPNQYSRWSKPLRAVIWFSPQRLYVCTHCVTIVFASYQL